MKEKIIKYLHHDNEVNVLEHLKGEHRKHCLCFKGCKYFKPNQSDNCEIAQELFELDVKHGLTTPVWECPKFEQM